MSPTRRQALTAVASGAVAAGAAAALAGCSSSDWVRPGPADSSGKAGAVGSARVSPFGVHQAGIATPAPARVMVTAFTLRPGADKAALGRLMRLWSEDVKALTQGTPATGDPAWELVGQPSSLTITVGFGPAVFALEGLRDKAPAGLVTIPPMVHDKLQDRWSGGDLVVQVCADDSLVISHVTRRMVVDAAPFATVRWQQSGFWRASGVGTPGETGRNLMGQVDGTGNLPVSDPQFASVVWSSGSPEWLQGGSMMVVRRIQMALDTWDLLPRDKQEAVIGRRLDTGAPLTLAKERDPLPLDARGADGKPVIPDDAHARLANPNSNGGLRILRRAANYDAGLAADGTPDAGLLFISFQADIAKQFVPIQQRLDGSDSLNKWTTALGSAVFAVPPGFGPDTWIGKGLLA
ncbi:MAG TPA: Dyp-type peroxidase [Kineosporiaceae bacterium]|nr:Dyp-type peroxidase [Kineosporiaceae bacterium]